MALAPGTRLGAYEIVGLIGAGGMGEVYRAHDSALGRDVAIKVLPSSYSADPARLKRFEAEARAAAALNHPNILTVHQVGVHEGSPFIVSELLEGQTLREVLANGPVHIDKAIPFVREICLGLEAAHEQGIVHRDLKPENIFVTHKGRLKILDFGLAKSLTTSAETVGITRTGELFGTPQYISPEQIRGQEADQRSDLYALGIVAFELLTGQNPHPAGSSIEVIYQRLHAAPKDPGLVKADLPRHVREIVRRCLEPEPADRYATARDLLNALDLESTAPVSASRRRTWRATIPSRRAIATMLAVVAIVAVAAYGFWPGDRGGFVASEERPRRLAILPFRAIGEQLILSEFAVAVEEALGAKLFQIPSLTVSSAAAVERAMARDSENLIARALGVDVLITGTVQGNEESIRVTVSADDHAGGGRMWAEDFVGHPRDLLTLEDEIYTRLIVALRLNPTSNEQAKALSHPTENIDAYRLYMKGRTAMRQQQDPKNVLAAIRFYEEALKHEPTFARAYAAISDSALRLYRATKDPTWATRALGAAKQAESLDDQLLEVRLALGSIYQATGRTAEALIEFTKASEVAPTSADVASRLARAYLAIGRAEEAIQAYERAITLDPYHWVGYGALGTALMGLGQYERAVSPLQKVTELEPENAGGHNDLGAVYLQMGRYAEAEDAFRKALKLQPIAQTFTNLGITYGHAGKYAEAIEMFEKAVDLSPNDAMFIGNLGDGYRWAGDRTQASAAYDRAIALALKDLGVNPRNATARGQLALYYAKQGDYQRARRMISDARSINAASADLKYQEAVVHVFGGALDDAYRTLDEVLSEGYPVSAVQTDLDLASIAGDARFKQLLDKYRTRK